MTLAKSRGCDTGEGGTGGALSMGMNTTTKTTYETPVGTFRTWEEAADACERADMDPCDCIKMVHASASIPPSLVSYELGPGGLVRLSFQIKCF